LRKRGHCRSPERASSRRGRRELAAGKGPKGSGTIAAREGDVGGENRATAAARAKPWPGGMHRHPPRLAETSLPPRRRGCTCPQRYRRPRRCPDSP
jgi:hypothetical protein